jgi:hypothetical protein
MNEARLREALDPDRPPKWAGLQAQPNFRHPQVGHEWHGSPARVRLRLFWLGLMDRKGSAIRRSNSEFFGVIRVGRQHSVSPANRSDPAL